MPLTSAPPPLSILWTEGPVLGVETSCDETAAAVVGPDGTVLSNVIASQHAVHERFGGVVPELASRAHVETIERIVARAMEESALSWHELTGIAVTQGPGLAGALIVGLNYAKALGYALHIPVAGVGHLEGHIVSAWLQDPSFPSSCIVLVVSGGHTHLYQRDDKGSCRLLGRTRDDAAGEAFDKGAQMLGLGFPGGPALDRLAQTGNQGAVSFPKSSLRKPSLDFSFSGLKTALLYRLQGMESAQIVEQRADVAASYQEAIVTALVEKAFSAVRQTGMKALAVVGGVSANSRLRTLLRQRAGAEGVRLSIPPFHFCTDNAAMIAAAGLHAFRSGRRLSFDAEAMATWDMPLTGAEV
ncbi:MAG TPA: tRNA (adenosine(37)-N6)-threonylcarbamoyltransferase complex transferase subunit TsaD [Nitrospira sp.]|nr:tRNA (adenosine(37)-N6)-threonylcarbamoyltransferase complex transferase subunit TsaD [Nitrospira sp.]